MISPPCFHVSTHRGVKCSLWPLGCLIVLKEPRGAVSIGCQPVMSMMGESYRLSRRMQGPSPPPVFHLSGNGFWGWSPALPYSRTLEMVVRPLGRTPHSRVAKRSGPVFRKFSKVSTRPISVFFLSEKVSEGRIAETAQQLARFSVPKYHSRVPKYHSRFLEWH